MAFTTSQGASIRISVDGAEVSQRQIDSIAQSMNSLSTTVQNATRNLATGIGLGGGLVQIVQLSDQYTKLTSQLRLATDSTAAYATAYADVKRIAAEAQSELAGTGVLYSKIAKGTKELGISQKNVADITEVISLSLKVGAASAEETASAQLALGQAFAAGALRGEDFNSVNEASPRILQALADGMGVSAGALKSMAENGLLTSEVMAEVLPKALGQLRQEAANIQTISGAFEGLKSKALEFTAVNAQASGSVAAITGAINLLANNLVVLAGALVTVTAVKTVNWLVAWTTETYRKIAADQASRAAAIAAAQADLARVEATAAQAAATQAAIVTARAEMVARLSQANANILAAKAAIQAATAAGAQSFALRTLRLSTAELAVAEAARSAALAELSILGQQAARVSAQITAAQTAEAAAARSVAAAQGAAGVATGLASRALGLLGGPIGAVIAGLGIVATAWQWYSSKSEEANRKAKESTEESSNEIIENLDKQTQKLRERVALAKQGGFQLEVAKDGGPGAERLAGYLKQINELKAQGNQLSAADQVMLINLEGLYGELLKSVTAYKQVKAELDATGAAAKDVIEIRQRLTGVNKQYLEDLSKLETAREKGAVTESEYIELVTKLATETYKSSDAGKEATASANKAKEAYGSLISSIREKIASNRLEAAVGENATESQKALIKLDQETAAGKLKLSAAQMGSVRAAITEMAVTEQRLKQRDAERDVAKFITSSTQARNASLASLQAEYATYGQSADARELAMVKVRAEAELERKLADLREAKKPVTDDMIAQLRTETAERVQVEQATLAQTKALGYAYQLEQENKRTAAESISDPRAREQAMIDIDANAWRERIRLAGEGTQAQKALQEQFDTWYANRKKVSNSNIDLTQAAALLDILTAVDDAAKSAAQGMEASFRRVGAAVGKLTTTLTGYQRTEAAIAAQRAASIKDAGGDQVKIQRANDAATEASAQAQIKSYGDMASAAKGFFDENSTGYKVLGGIEKAYRAAEMAMALETMAKKIFFKETEVAANTTLNATKLTGEAATSAASTGLAATEASAWGVTAVVKAIASLPFPLNLAAGAATLAAVVAVGAKVVGSLGGSSVSLSKQRQETQGTGTVLGDKSAKSESIARAIELSASNSSTQINYLSAMTASLHNIESSISSFASLLVRTVDFSGSKVNLNTNNGGATTGLGLGLTAASAGVGYAAGAGLTAFTSAGAIGGPIGLAAGALLGYLASKSSFVGKIATSIFGGKQSVEDSGITMSPSALAAVLAGGANVQQYTAVKTSGGWFHGDKRDTKETSLGAEANQQITTVIKSLADTVKEAGNLIGLSGDEFTQKLNGFVVDIGKVSLKDLKGDALQKELSAIFSKLGDDMAQYAVAGLEQFQQVGEGYLETLVRVTTDYAKLDASLTSIGAAFGATGLQSIAARESLIALVGGIDELQSKTASFAENFLTEAERLAPVQKYVSNELAKLNLGWVDTREEFKKVVLGLDLTTESGRTTYAALMGLSEAFAATHEAIKDTSRSVQDIADERKDLQDRLDDLTMTALQLREKERAGIADVNKALYDQVQAAQAAKDAIETQNSLLDLHAQIYELTGDKAAAAAVLEKQHAAALASLDPALRGATQQLWDLQAAAKASEQIKTDAAALLGGVDSAFSVLQKVVDREKSAIQKSIDVHTESVNKLKSLADSLHSTLDSLKSPDQKLAERAVGQAQIRAALAIARAGGPLPDADNLKGALAAVQQDASSQFSSYADYLRDLYQTQNDIGALADLTDDSLSVEEKALQTAQDQLTSLNGILTNAQEQIDVLKGQSTTLISIHQAMGALTQAIQAAQANPVVSATSSIAQAYQAALGRAPDAAGLEFWQDKAASGVSTPAIVDAISNSAEAKNRAAIKKLYEDLLGRQADDAGLSFFASNGSSLSDIAAAIKGSDEYKKLHPFAVGTNYIPEDMPAFVHAGERIIPAADNRELMQRLSSPAENNAALVAELRALRAEVQELRETNSKENYAIAKGAQAGAEHLESALYGEVSLTVKVVPA